MTTDSLEPTATDTPIKPITETPLSRDDRMFNLIEKMEAKLDAKDAPIVHKLQRPEAERLYIRFMEAAFAGIMGGENGANQNGEAVAMLANGVAQMSIQEFFAQVGPEGSGGEEMQEARDLYLRLMAAAITGSMSSDAGRRRNPQAIAMSASGAARTAVSMMLSGTAPQAQQAPPPQQQQAPQHQTPQDIPPGYGMSADGLVPLPSFMQGMQFGGPGGGGGMGGGMGGSNPFANPFRGGPPQMEIPEGAVRNPNGNGYSRTVNTGAGGVKFEVEIGQPPAPRR